MKILQASESIQSTKFCVIEAKTVQIKKVTSIHDMMALKQKMGGLKRAFKIG